MRLLFTVLQVRDYLVEIRDRQGHLERVEVRYSVSLGAAVLATGFANVAAAEAYCESHGHLARWTASWHAGQAVDWNDAMAVRPLVCVALRHAKAVA